MNSVDVSETGPVEGWFETGAAWLDTRFGDGFAAKNPQLLAAYVQACALVAIRSALTDELVNAMAAIDKAVGARGE